uniref:ubiquitinyl hydrolase 1 n=1 Tax=Gadus morhua TaxID=8049 RepID=A0A8C5AQB6_GADMO
MSGGPQPPRRRRKMFLISRHLKLQDQLEGTICLERGSICQEQSTPSSRADQSWVKVNRNAPLSMLLYLHDSTAGLLEAVPEAEARLKLFGNPLKLRQLAALPLGAALMVQRSQSDEFMEAELRFRGPMTRGGSAIMFGVELKGAAAGHGVSSSYKGQSYFICPKASALFVPANRIHVRRLSRGNATNPGQEHRREGQPLEARVCFPLEDRVQGGEVRYCGPLPGRASSGTYVGVLLVCVVVSPCMGYCCPSLKSPKVLGFTFNVGASPIYDLSSSIFHLSFSLGPSPTTESRSNRLPGPVPSNPKPILKPPPQPYKVLPPVPVPPPKPQALPSPITTTTADQPWPPNGEHAPASPAMLSPGGSEDGGWRDRGTDVAMALEVGSMVEVNDPPLFGVIRWIGRISGINQTVAGLELDQELAAATDGSYLGNRYFRCPANKGLFVKLRNCRRDSRFPAPETPVNQVERCNSIAFAEWGSERVEEPTAPLEGGEVLEVLQGWKRGIQGHLNSCYLDASLFSLFSCCSSADWVMLSPPGPSEPPGSGRAKDLLRCEIVNPLRRFGYVCASKTMSLRLLLEADNHDAGFTNQEKDPEEFLNMLFQLFHVEPLLKIRSMSQEPQECHLYQLFPPTALPHSPAFPLPSPPLSPSLSPPPALPQGPGPMRVASVQAMLDSSFLHTGLKFVEAPSCLLLLMPRFGKDFKMFDAISPTLSLDITDLLDDTLRQCSICQAVAEWECSQCYPDQDITPGRLKQYCPTCNTQVHSHRKRLGHTPEPVRVPGGPWAGPLHGTRQRLELFAVTCIETSHYVSLVKHGPRPSDWLFFDSMADREGGENGFNIPQVRACPEVGRFLSLSEEELSRVEPASLPEPARRLLCDAYMCFYHSPELSLYK